MFEMNVPGDLLGSSGTPDLKKVLNFVLDDIKSRENKTKRGVFSKPVPPRYRDFTLADAMPLLEDPDVLLSTCWAELSPLLAEHIYLALLKRPSDPVGKAGLAAKIAADRSLINALQLVLTSAEYQQKNAPKQLPLSGKAAWVDQAVRIATRYGRADVNLQELLSLAGPDGHLGHLHRSLWQRQPPDWSQKKVLLFGAFGNGNMGDAYQALAMRDHVHSIMGVPLEHIFACSVLDQADFPFPSAQKRPAANLLNTDALNHFGMLVIGGGGLLAHPHAPLLSTDWISRLTLPIMLVGLGASRHLASEFAPLAKLAVAVSGRDSLSINAFEASGVVASCVPDAIASVRDPAVLMEFDPAIPAAVEAALVSEGVEPFDWMWIVKYANNVEEQALLDQIRSQIDLMGAGLRHCVIGIEPELDKALEDQFPEIKLVSALNRLWPLMQRAQRVCTMRFHGGIFALLQGKPVVGCAQVKLKMLKENWDASLTYADTATDLPGMLNACSSQVKSGFSDRNSMQAALNAFLTPFANHA